MNKPNKGKIYCIYIGLKDKDTYQELLDTETFKQILKKHCESKKIGFSCTSLFGGYEHNKGYVTENSLRITLIGAKQNEVSALAQSLKQIVNTDTVLVSVEKCIYLFF